MLLKGKGWIAQDFYNEYLELTVSIQQLTREIEYLKYRKPTLEELLKEKTERLDEKIERFRFVVEQLRLKNVNAVDLLLLSIGVDLQ